jgi:hypothetical protein
MTTIRMETYGGRNYAMPMLTNIEIIAPGVGKSRLSRPASVK